MDKGTRSLLFHTSPLRKSYRPKENFPSLANTSSRHAVEVGEIKIPHGGVIAIVGESGTGKTTLFNMLGGLDVPDYQRRSSWWSWFREKQRGDKNDAHQQQPSIRLCLEGTAIDIVAEPQRFPRAFVGYVFQSGFLLNNASAALNMSLPLAQQGRFADRADLEQRLSSLGFDPSHVSTELDERAWKFSGGEAQRIAFVRSLAHAPRLIFADEPTSNVDYRNALAIMEQLRDWCASGDNGPRTVLWITHDLKLAASVADAVLILHRNCPEPLWPVCLPAEASLEERTRTLERWSYDREAMLADGPMLYQGREENLPQSVPAPSRSLSQTRATLGAIVKLALSEVFARHAAQRLKLVRDFINPTLSVRAGSANTSSGVGALLGWIASPDSFKAFAAWTWSFGQRTAALALALIMVLGTATFTFHDVIEEQNRRSLSDPRNCHTVVTEVAGGQGGDPGYGDIQALGRRPWLSSHHPGGAVAGAGLTTSYARATCSAGAAAYGRRYARDWAVAIEHDGGCPSSRGTKRTYVRLLVADEKEPVWSNIPLRAVVGDSGATTVGRYIDGLGKIDREAVYLTDKFEKRIGAKKIGDLVGSWLCFYDRGWDEPMRLRIVGIVSELPSWDLNDFEGFFSDGAYQSFRRNLKHAKNAGLLESYTDIALYFASENIDHLERYLKARHYGYDQSSLDTIRRLIEDANFHKRSARVLGLVVVTLLVMMTTISVVSYLSKNNQSFALLKAFGMPYWFLAGVLTVQMTIGWLVGALLVAMTILGLDVAMGGEWGRIDETLVAASRVWLPFLLSAGIVWLLSLAVGLGVIWYWWVQNRFVANSLKTG